MSRLYLKCEKCPLDIFWDCLFDKDYRRLIIEGDATEEALLNTWQNLYAEFRQLINAEEHDEYLDLLMQANEALSTIYLVDGILVALLAYYDPYLIEILDELGLQPGVDFQTTESEMSKRLSIVRTRAKKYVVAYERIKAQLDKLETQSTRDAGGRGDHEDLLQAISKEQGYQIQPSQITVSQFCRQVNRLKEKALAAQAAERKKQRT